MDKTNIWNELNQNTHTLNSFCDLFFFQYGQAR